MAHLIATHPVLFYFTGVLISFILIRRKHKEDFHQTWWGVIFCLFISLLTSWIGILFWLSIGGSKSLTRLRKHIGSQFGKEPPKWL